MTEQQEIPNNNDENANNEHEKEEEQDKKETEEQKKKNAKPKKQINPLEKQKFQRNQKASQLPTITPHTPSVSFVF